MITCKLRNEFHKKLGNKIRWRRGALICFRGQITDYGMATSAAMSLKKGAIRLSAQRLNAAIDAPHMRLSLSGYYFT